MKVILYIGHHKVGSTSLQVFLSQNYLSLLKAGILYPAVDMRGLAHNLHRAVQGKDTPGILPMNIREPHNALAFRLMSEETSLRMPAFYDELPSGAQMIVALRQQVEQLAPKTVILCAEVLANFAAAYPDGISRLREVFPGARFSIYCALRRPDSYLASWHGQRLKFGDKIYPLRKKATGNYLKTIHFDYRLMLEGWLEGFPDADFHIRNYTDILATGGSIEDFFTRLHLPDPGVLLPAKRANTSLDLALYEIARLGNHHLSREDARFLRWQLGNARKFLKVPPNSEIEMFGAENRDLMMTHFAPIETFLAQVTSKKVFFDDLDEMAQTRPLPELDAMSQILHQLGPLKRRLFGSPAIRSFLSDLRRDHA